MTPDELDRHDRFMQLFLQHEESLRAFVRSLVPTLEDAREIVQNVSAVLWRKFDELHSPDEFRRWAFGVARLETLQYRRTKCRDRHVFGEDIIAVLANSAEDAADSLDAERRALEYCLQRLPEAQRKLITAAYAPGVRIDELATKLGRTAMALYKTLHRIRLTLMACTERVLSQETAS